VLDLRRLQVAVNVYNRDNGPALRKHTVTLWSPKEGTRQTMLGGLTGVEAVGLNQAGHVLIRGRSNEAPRPQATHVWQNGVLTPVTGSIVKGQAVFGNAINDSGTVVGCLYNFNRTLSRAAFTPFIWQRGVMENLNTHLARVKPKPFMEPPWSNTPSSHWPPPSPDMDNTGKVVGHPFDQVLVIAGSIVFGSRLEYAPRIRAASWSATRSSTITGVRGASKGVKLPAGTIIDCPVAINDGGSIATSVLYPVDLSGPYPTYRREWIRLNAVP
jgi:hypothetical protein